MARLPRLLGFGDLNELLHQLTDDVVRMAVHPSRHSA